MEYLNIGVIMATAMIFTWIGYFFSKTKDSKTLLANSEVFNDIIIELQEEIVNEIQTSQRERGKMLLNQEKIDEMIKVYARTPFCHLTHGYLATPRINT